MNLAELEAKTKEELLEMAQQLGLQDGNVRRDELVFKILEATAHQQGFVLATGILELAHEGYGFLRQNMGRQGQGDVYISQSQIRRFGLRTGDQVTGQVRPPKEGERYYGLIRVEAVNGMDAEQARLRPNFDNLTPIFPNEHLKLETTPQNLAQRMIDLIAPVGKGQRA
ncbi:MAG: transcription termination factor Rho, partial [SAR202 cluster bacterium]|nr:transcription termination factor Rho [SAR202 cluster bacterium]